MKNFKILFIVLSLSLTCSKALFAQQKTESFTADEPIMVDKNVKVAACTPGIVMSVSDIPGSPVGFRIQFNLVTWQTFLYPTNPPNPPRKLKVFQRKIGTNTWGSMLIYGTNSTNLPYTFASGLVAGKTYEVKVQTLDGSCESIIQTVKVN
jgi:hypothetical protein